MYTNGTYFQNDPQNPIQYGKVNLINPLRQRLRGEPLLPGIEAHPVFQGFCGTDYELMKMGAEGKLYKKFPAGENTGMIVTYNCSKCGKKVKSTVKFCPDCGGEVIKAEKEANPKFACSSCGTPAKAGVKFCSQCGGAIVQLERVVEPTYVCSSCGAASEADVKFCSKCGGAIIQK